MCNLYSVTKSQSAIIELTRAMRDRTGNLPPMPGVFPDYPAPIVRNAPDGVRELMLARWGMPGPPAIIALIRAVRWFAGCTSTAVSRFCLNTSQKK
jgi:putative SOS response-associated peptidase YedK